MGPSNHSEIFYLIKATSQPLVSFFLLLFTSIPLHEQVSRAFSLCLLLLQLALDLAEHLVDLAVDLTFFDLGPF